MRLSFADELVSRWADRDPVGAVSSRLPARGIDLRWTTNARVAGAVAHAVDVSDGGSLLLLSRAFESEAQLWEWFTRPFQAGEPASSPLEELVVSIACEQHARTELGDEREKAVRAARQNLDAVLAIEMPKVRGFVARAPSPDDAANEGVARAIAKFWAEGAQERFIGVSRVSTLLCSFARFVLLEQVRDAKRRLGPDAAGDGAEGQQTDRVELEELQAAYVGCLGGLAAKEREMTDLFLRHRVPVGRIAELFGCGVSNVSQRVSAGREKLRACMGGRGFSLQGT